jgi:protein-S-isoprenylcysteine O-methyltransferase Ste14
MFNRRQKKEEAKIHTILAYSYSVYFVLLLIGIFLDLFLPLPLFIDQFDMYILGFLFLFLASFLIIWAQRSTHSFWRKEKVSHKSFCRGPYCFTRTPTHWGLFLLVLGFGFIMNASYVIVFTIISFLISKFFFLKKQEDLLERKYGGHYKEYKNKIRF